MEERNQLFAPNKRSVNLIILFCTCFVFFVMLIWEKVRYGTIADGNSTFFLLEHGALHGTMILKYHQWYRMVTYVFLHGGIEHIVNNMLILYFMGNALERFLGRIRYVILYFFSGILAGICSIMYNGYNLTGSFSIAKMAEAEGYPVCIGASGAVFGVIGAMAYLVVLYRGSIKGLSKQQMLLFVVLSVYGGLVDKGVDNAAHLGGLVAGFVLAAMLYRKRKTEEVDSVRNGANYAD